MEITDTYLNFKPTYKYYYLKNNNIDSSKISNEDLFLMLMQDIDIIFNYLKISPSKTGYAYWKDAVLLSVLCEKEHLSICNDIYPMIAKKYNKSTISIERAMRLCFEDAMYNSRGDENFIVLFLKHFLIQPQNSKLLMKIVELVVSVEFKRFKKSISI